MVLKYTTLLGIHLSQNRPVVDSSLKGFLKKTAVYGLIYLKFLKFLNCFISIRL